MTEQHECEWWKVRVSEFMGEVVCREGCTMSISDALGMLNGYETPKRATEALSADFAVGLAEWCEAMAMEKEGENTTGNTLRAYADILEKEK